MQGNREPKVAGLQRESLAAEPTQTFRSEMIVRHRRRLVEWMSMERITYRSLWRYKYQLVEPYDVATGLDVGKRIGTESDWVVLDQDGRLSLRAGYAWDGPSGPTLDTSTFMRPSLVHDALYQLMRTEQLDRDQWREPADRLLRTMCREDGMNRFRAWYVYRGVRLKGHSSTTPRAEPETRTAPSP